MALAQADAPQQGEAPAASRGRHRRGRAGGGRAGGRGDGPGALRQPRGGGAAAGAALGAVGRGELGLLTLSQQEPESISADNLYGNEDDEANLRQMDNEDLGLVPRPRARPPRRRCTRPCSSSAPRRRCSCRSGRRARPSLSPADDVNTQESGASLAPTDAFAARGHYMLPSRARAARASRPR